MRARVPARGNTRGKNQPTIFEKYLEIAPRRERRITHRTPIFCRTKEILLNDQFPVFRFCFTHYAFYGCPKSFSFVEALKGASVSALYAAAASDQMRSRIQTGTSF